MTAPPVATPERIDLTALTDTFRILPTSRSWSGVASSIRTLEARSRAEWRQPDLQDHSQNVEVFADTIREFADLIAYSFICAAALARLAPPSSGTSTYRMLQTLSSTFNFRQLSSPEVHERLRTVWTALRRYELGTEPIPAPQTSSGDATVTHEPLPDGGSPKVQTDVDVEPYFVWLEKVLAGVRAAPVLSAAALARVQSDAWRSVRGRYEDVACDLAERVPAAAEVICRAAQLLPSAMLGFSIPETPALAWADLVLPGALSNATIGSAMPWWAHGLAAHALGFRSPDMSGTRDLFSFLSARGWPGAPTARRGVQPLPEWDEFFRASSYLTAKRAHPQAVYVVRRAQDSLMARWTTSPAMATLPLTTGQVNALLSGDTSMAATLGAVLWRSSDECVVALEYPLDSPDHAAAASSLLKLLVSARGSDARISRVSFGPLEQRPQSLVFGGEYLRRVPQRFEDLAERVQPAA